MSTVNVTPQLVQRGLKLVEDIRNVWASKSPVEFAEFRTLFTTLPQAVSKGGKEGKKAEKRMTDIVQQLTWMFEGAEAEDFGDAELANYSSQLNNMVDYIVSQVSMLVQTTSLLEHTVFAEPRDATLTDRGCRAIVRRNAQEIFDVLINKTLSADVGNAFKPLSARMLELADELVTDKSYASTNVIKQRCAQFWQGRGFHPVLMKLRNLSLPVVLECLPEPLVFTSSTVSNATTAMYPDGLTILNLPHGGVLDASDPQYARARATSHLFGMLEFSLRIIDDSSTALHEWTPLVKAAVISPAIAKLAPSAAEALRACASLQVPVAAAAALAITAWDSIVAAVGHRLGYTGLTLSDAWVKEFRKWNLLPDDFRCSARKHLLWPM